MGLDTAETRACCPKVARLAQIATKYLTELASRPDVLFCPDGEDRYDRTKARKTVDGADVAEMVIAERPACEYRGGRRRGWCGE